MATVLSPGVFFQELDLSQYISDLSQTILALVITATRGPVNTPILVTSYTNFENLFGVPNELHPGMLTAREYLQSGRGNQLWVVRVTDTTDTAATATITNIDATTFVFTAATTGSFMNSISFPISYGNQLSQTYTHSETYTSGTNTITFSLPSVISPAQAVPVVPGTFVVKIGGVTAGQDNGNQAILFNSSFPTYSGTVDYSTGAVSIVVTGASISTVTYLLDWNVYSTFTVQTLLNITNNDAVVVARTVLETFTGLTLATSQAGLATSNYIAPLEDNMTVFPAAGVYAFSGGTDGISTINDANFIGTDIGGVATGMQNFADPAVIDINVICCPGQTSAGVRQALIELCTNRQDAMCILDPPSGITVQEVVDWANATGSYSSYGVVDSNYAAIYYPWYTSTNPDTGDVELTPPSAAICQVLARTQYWQAPAGPINSLLLNCLDTSVHVNSGDREYLGSNRINPIGNLAGLGIQILGQYTATEFQSSLDRVAARQTLLVIEKAVTTAMYTFLFQPNIQSTWTQATGLVQPYLNSLVAQGRLYAAQFYCDSTTNTPEIVNQNEMSGVVVLELLKYAERILITFQLEAFGVAITESIVSANIPGT